MPRLYEAIFLESPSIWTVSSVGGTYTKTQARAVAELLNKIEPGCHFHEDCHGQGCPFTLQNCPHLHPTGDFIIAVRYLGD